MSRQRITRAAEALAAKRRAWRAAGACTECGQPACLRIIADHEGRPISWSTMTRCPEHRTPAARDNATHDSF